MMPKIAIARALKKLTPFTAALMILTSGAAYAQLGTPNGSGVTSLTPGTPSASSPVAGTGIPLGATELGTSGLSPPPFATTSGLGVGTTLPGVAGSTSPFGNGLSPGVMPPQTMAVSPGTTAMSAGTTAVSPGTTIQTPAVTNPRITNYGPGGTQRPPGSTPRFR